MAVNTKVGLITEIDKLINLTELNQETQGLLQHLYAGVQQVDRSFVRETNFKAKRKGGNTAPKTNMPPNYVPTKEELAAIEKKRMNPPAPPVEIKQDDATQVTVEVKEQPNEGELLDIITDGLEKAKENYKNPKAFAKKLKSIGIEAEGKTHEELFKVAKTKFDEISA